MPKPVKYHVINGKRYKIEFVPQSIFGDNKTAGDCDSPNKKKKKIRIHNKLNEGEEMRVILHECLHSLAFEMFDENWVDIASRDIARLLIRLGYRREK